MSESHERFQQLIDEMLTGGGPVPEAAQLREHLQTCAACRSYLDTTMRAVTALNGFSFPVNDALPAQIAASLRLRSQQRAPHHIRWQTAVLASFAALVLTLSGSFIDLRLSGVLALVLDVRQTGVEHALLNFWITPSLTLLLVFPLLPLLGQRTRGAL